MHKIKDITLKRTELEINYEDWVNKKNKNTIVILHGWGGSSQSWLTVGELLFQNGFNVIIPDLPGFGKTELNRVFDIEEYALVIEKFIKELGLEDIILWGHSNGGAISIKIASRGKIKISRLVLINSAGIRSDKKRNLKRQILGNIVKSLRFLKRIPGSSKLREYFYRAIGSQDYLEAEKNPFLKQTYLNMISSDLSDDIIKINADTLLIWGRLDSYTPLSDGLKMRKNIKKSKIIIMDNEKHGIHIKSPEKLVNTFLNNI